MKRIFKEEEEIRKAKKAITIMLCFLICALMTSLVRYFVYYKNYSISKDLSINTTLIPIYSNITPTKTAPINVTNNPDKYRLGQGMTVTNINGKSYILTAVIISGGNADDRNTYIHITDTSGNILAIVADYSFGHANTMSSDEDYIYIYNAKKKKLVLLDNRYVTDAVAKYSKTGKIVSGFTEQYLIYGDGISINKSLSSISYDRKYKKMYASNKTNLYSFSIENGKITFSKPIAYSKFYEQSNTNDYTNAGVAVYGEYLLVGRYYSTKKGFNGVLTDHNTIDIFRCKYNSETTISSISYVGTYIFNSGTMQQDELEDMEISDTNPNVLVLHYNGKNSIVSYVNKKRVVSYYNYIHNIDLSKINFVTINGNYDGKTVNGGGLVATLYDSRNKEINTYRTNKYANLTIAGLKKDSYKLKFTSVLDKSYKSMLNKEVEFEVNGSSRQTLNME